MCGIAGVLATNNQDQQQLNAIIQNIVASQLSRGPDNQQIDTIAVSQGTAIFGHNRLSIFDLSDTANQPMWDDSRRYCLVFNGAIYNYLELRQELSAQGQTFSTTSDTEVLLAAFKHWSINAVERCVGMFAFALLDIQANELWLVRDRFGKKPLFYYADNKQLFFASSSRELARAFNLKPNLDYVARGLQYYLYEDGSEITPYEKLFSVKPGHYLKISFDTHAQLQIQEKSYYDFSEQVQVRQQQIANLASDQLLALVNQQLTNAIDFRHRADVPLGIALSGGLDSATIAALSKQQAGNLLAFNFGEPTDKKTEGPIVANLSERLALQTIYVNPKADELVAGFWQALAAQNAPFPNLSIVAQYLVYQNAARQGVKVMLGGQGGDEAFLGYRKFQLFYVQQLIKSKQYWQASKFLLNCVPLALAELPRANLYWRNRKRYTDKAGLRQALHLPTAKPVAMQLGNCLQTRQISDLTQMSLPTLLRYEDSNSMANSVESRLPFLDHRLVELAVALPTTLKLQRGYGKWIVRELTKEHLPEEIRLARYKRGFDVLTQQWLTAGLGQSLRENFNEHFAVVKNFLPAGVKVESLFSDQALLQQNNRLSEAISLSWLSGCYSTSVIPAFA